MPKFASESALTANLSEDEILAKLIALNAERAEEEKRGFVRWLRPGYERARAGAALEPAQVLSEEQLEVTAVVFAALMQASEPLDAGTIAKSFRQGRKVEPAISIRWKQNSTARLMFSGSPTKSFFVIAKTRMRRQLNLK